MAEVLGNPAGMARSRAPKPRSFASPPFGGFALVARPVTGRRSCRGVEGPSVRRTDERSPHLATILDLCHTTSYGIGSHHIRQLGNITFGDSRATQMRPLVANAGEKRRGRRSGGSDGRVSVVRRPARFGALCPGGLASSVSGPRRRGPGLAATPRGSCTRCRCRPRSDSPAVSASESSTPATATRPRRTGC